MSVRYTADRSGVSITEPACATEEHSDTEDLPPINVRISVFFDGTGNNIFNTGSRLHRLRTGVSVEGLEGSYVNSYSNVARLATSLQLQTSENDFHIPVYVEGMGTYHYSGDDWILGSGMGIGGHGVIARVSTCISHVRNAINNVRNGNAHISHLKIDAFGFSRGAAAARYFVHRVLETENITRASRAGTIDSSLYSLIHQLTVTDSITIDNYKMPFIGLFDTVGSHRESIVDGIEDDTAELHLDAIRLPQVEVVFHLAAADEHRMNFPLTNINSAINAGKGTQIFLPGVHSDIGGGYNEEHDGDMVENNLPVFQVWGGLAPLTTACTARLNVIKNNLISMGYYKASPQVEIHPGEFRNELAISETGHQLLATRTHISNRYSFVPLRIMAEKASEKELSFNLSSYRISNDSFLVRIKSRIQNNTSTNLEWMASGATDPQLQQLRHNYCHFSSHFITTLGSWPMAPQMYNAGMPDPWADNDSNNLHGIRRRKIHDG